MPRPLPLLIALAAAASVGACVSPVAYQDGVTATGSIATTTTVTAAAPRTGATAASWQMPVQIVPGGASAEATTIAFVPGTGLVRGTSASLATVGQPMVEAPGRNRTVQACRDVVTAEAMKLGATQVEAVSAGPDRVARGGRVVGTVDVRITYAGATAYEVRTARMTCIVDTRGKIVDAFV